MDEPAQPRGDRSYKEAEAGLKKLLAVLACAQKMALNWSAPSKYGKVAVPNLGVRPICGKVAGFGGPARNEGGPGRCDVRQAIAHGCEKRQFHASPNARRPDSAKSRVRRQSATRKSPPRRVADGRSRRRTTRRTSRSSTRSRSIGTARWRSRARSAPSRRTPPILVQGQLLRNRLGCARLGNRRKPCGVHRADGEPRVKASFDFRHVPRDREPRQSQAHLPEWELRSRRRRNWPSCSCNDETSRRMRS